MPAIPCYSHMFDIHGPQTLMGYQAPPSCYQRLLSLLGINYVVCRQYIWFHNAWLCLKISSLSRYCLIVYLDPQSFRVELE